MSQVAKESPCPECGEMVRINSLRCWNCGAFMNPELERKYLAMQANPAPIIRSEVPDDELHSMDEGEDDDFELSMPLARTEADSSSASEEKESEEETLASETAEAKPARRASEGDSDIPHSQATGGDVLLNIAMQEQAEQRKRQKGRRQIGGLKTPGGGIIIFCPYGCKIEVKERHRGMTGRCPRCSAPFIVPVDPPQFRKRATAEGAAAGEAAEQTSAETVRLWMQDLHLHVVIPEKFKLKADSLLKDYVPADVGMLTEQLLVAVLGRNAKGGLFPKGNVKVQPLRETMQQHFADNRPVEELNVGEKLLFSRDDLSQLKVVQPAASRGESIFHGIPVFGEGRIAFQLPHTEQTVYPMYLSMGITQYWEFAKGIEETYGLTALGGDSPIPTEPKYQMYRCQILDIPVKGLQDVAFYKADPKVQLQAVGYQCGTCKTVVSEEGRAKEKLGGKTPKGIAKAKCPKCSSKMGDNPLYLIKEEASNV